MCTAFVRKGNEVIVGFNMDINIDAFEYKIFKEKDMFYIGIKMNSELELPEGITLPYSIDSKNGVCKVHGVNSKGNFANMLNNMNFSKAKFRMGNDICMHDQLVEDYISGRCDFDELIRIANEKDIVGVPKGVVNIPDLAFHSLIADRKGNIMMLEPGNGYSIIKEKYAALTNFSILELPADFNQDRFGYYGKDRYDIAMDLLRNSDDDFQVEDGLEILKATKQEGNWATRVSFVYSNNDNAVYYCLEGDFDHISKHQFI